MKIRTLTLALLFALLAVSCTGKKNAGNAAGTTAGYSIAVFVPGTVSGSPVYEMLVAGVTRAVTEAAGAGQKATVAVIEAGTKQADWGTKMTALAAEKKYSLIISSNPAMPEIIAPVSEQFPDQDFLVFDASFAGNPKITTFAYNQREQAYISGYMAALVSTSSMKFANAKKKIGLVAGQEYPAMLNIILPGYLEGARAVDPLFEVDFRIVGNWYDAAKGAELARAMKNDGVDIIMPISGGANQGVIAAAQEAGFYVAWFDDNGYAKAPGFVVSSAVMAQERLAYEQTKAYLAGTLVRGAASSVGLTGKYIDFVSDDPLFIQTVPQNLRDAQAALMQKLYSGEIDLPVK